MVAAEPDIQAALAAARKARHPIPFYGKWQKPPFPTRTVGERSCLVLCIDDMVPGHDLVLDLTSGEIGELDPDDQQWALVSSSLDQLLACAKVLASATRRSAKIADDGDDEGLERIAAETLEAFREIDGPAVSEENTLWSIAAEELEYQ